LIQWGWEIEGDALTMVFASVMTQTISQKESDISRSTSSPSKETTPGKISFEGTQQSSIKFDSQLLQNDQGDSMISLSALKHTFKKKLLNRDNELNSPKIKKVAQIHTTHNTLAPALAVSAAEDSAPLPEALAALIHSARQLKVYVPTFIQNLTNKTYYAARHPGKKFIYAQNDPPLLAAVEDWLWIHNEYMAPNYLMRRIHHDDKMFTNNRSEADLCVLDCNAETEFVPDPQDHAGGERHRYPSFQVMPGSEWKFQGCSSVSLWLEGSANACGMPVPYFHSVYSPSISVLPPWNINAKRKTLLCFVGARKRGPCPGREAWNQSDCEQVRHTVLETMSAMSTTQNNSLEAKGGTRTLFASESPMWLQQAGMWDQSFFARAWGLYADSVFSWQPAGDTPTRRAFYDSWVLGCIPVISLSSAKHTYKEIFRGLIFSLAGLKIEDVVVVLPDEVMLRGELILAKLSAISEEEIRLRRRHLRSLAPLIQWGWEIEGDALTMVFASVMTQTTSM
jgi:hypothetical protein